jgi:hypothetical protein
MTMTPEETRYLADYKDLALRESVEKDRLAVENAALKEQLGAKPPAKSAEPAPLPAPPPPPVPVAPPPPPPASMSAFLAMPPHEQKHIAEAYGGRDKILESLDAEFHTSIQMGSASRGGFSGGLLTIPEKLGGPHELTAQERAALDLAAYGVGAPRPIPLVTVDPVKANLDALNRSLGWGAPKPTAKAAAPTPAPTPAKARVLGKR